MERVRLLFSMAARSYDNRICMGETYIRDGITYIDVYVPGDKQS